MALPTRTSGSAASLRALRPWALTLLVIALTFPSEGTPEWISRDSLDEESLVEDLPILLPKALASFEASIPFSARYTYDEAGALQIRFTE